MSWAWRPTVDAPQGTSNTSPFGATRPAWPHDADVGSTTHPAKRIAPVGWWKMNVRNGRSTVRVEHSSVRRRMPSMKPETLALASAVFAGLSGIGSVAAAVLSDGEFLAEPIFR